MCVSADENLQRLTMSSGRIIAHCPVESAARSLLNLTYIVWGSLLCPLTTTTMQYFCMISKLFKLKDEHQFCICHNQRRSETAQDLLPGCDEFGGLGKIGDLLDLFGILPRTFS